MSGRVVEDTGRPFSFSHAHGRNKKSHTQRPQAAPNLQTSGPYCPAKTVRNKKMFFIRTQRSGVHFGGHRRWPAAGQASPLRRPRAVAALPLTTDAGTGAALLAQPASLVAPGQHLRSGRGGPWLFGALALGYGPDHVAEDVAALGADFSVLGHDVRASRENASGEQLRIHHRLCLRSVHHRNRIPCGAAARSTRP